MDKLRLAVIGAGGFSQQYFSAAAVMDGIELTAVSDIVEEKAKKAAAEQNINWYTDYTVMMDKEKPDMVAIALPHFLHKPAALEAARRGIHIMLEKPMALSVEECDDIIAAARDNNVRLMIGHIIHFMESNMAVKKIVESGELGKLIMINDTRFSNYFAPERPQWFLTRKLSGGGILMNLGAHSIDGIQWITGSRVKKVSAKVTYLNDKVDVEGSGQLLLITESGVSAAINLNGYTTVPKHETEYMFEKGIIRVMGGKAYISRQGEKEFSELEWPYPSEVRMVAQLSELADSIRNGRETSIPGEYGKSVVAVIMAAYKSSESGQCVEL